MNRVFTIGDSYIDFIPKRYEINTSLKDINSFEKNLGGANATVAVGVSRLGGKSLFIGMVGKDSFGEFIIETFKKYNVDTSYIKKTSLANTGVTFSSTSKLIDREYCFYRNPSADMLLSYKDISEEWFKKGDILHFTSTDLIDEPVKLAHQKILFIFRKLGNIVSFDPNIRFELWGNKEECKKIINEFIPYTDIIKMNSNELEFITNIKNEEESVKALMRGNVKVVIITKGAMGATVYCNNVKMHCQGIKVDTIDISGAGDGFMAGFLYKLAFAEKTMKNLTKRDLRIMVKYANIIGALTTASRGTITAIPSINEVSNYFIKVHEEALAFEKLKEKMQENQNEIINT